MAGAIPVGVVACYRQSSWQVQPFRRKVLVVGRVTFAIRNVKVPLIIFVCTLMCGCERSRPVWSAESRSPDGNMIATAEALDNGGFVSPGPNATFVYLNWSTRSQARKEILAFSGWQSDTDGMKVAMNWLSPTHLELTYSGKQSVDFQAVKYARVDISVRALPSPSEPTSASH